MARDAMAWLENKVIAYADARERSTGDAKGAWRRWHLALRALLRERAEAAAREYQEWRCCEWKDTERAQDAIRAAVLGRPARRKK